MPPTHGSITKIKHYNILSVDGGGIRGIIPALFIRYMENASYEYAVSKHYIEENQYKKLAMYQLFDMIAGTSTGGILATALAAPSITDKTKPGFNADDIIKLYQDKGKEIFKKVGINKGLIGTITFFSIIIGAVLGYYLGVRIYSDSHTDENHRMLRIYIKELRKGLKGSHAIPNP